MNKPERLTHPNLTDWLPALRGEDDQKAIPRIARDADLIQRIEATSPDIPNTGCR
jgi:hypothetical protein